MIEWIEHMIPWIDQMREQRASSKAEVKARLEEFRTYRFVNCWQNGTIPTTAYVGLLSGNCLYNYPSHLMSKYHRTTTSFLKIRKKSFFL